MTHTEVTGYKAGTSTNYTGITMSTKAQELKELNAEKKAIAEKAKAIREELNETKVERVASRKAQAEARKQVREQKADLRDLSAKVYETFSSGDSEAVAKLADGIMESASELSATIRKFAEASASLEDL